MTNPAEGGKARGETVRLRQQPALADFVTLRPDQDLSILPIKLTDANGQSYRAVEVIKIEKLVGTDYSTERVDSLIVSPGMLRDAREWFANLPQADALPPAEHLRLFGIAKQLVRILNALEPNSS